MTDNLKSTKIDKFRPSDSSFVSNKSESYSSMSVDEDNDNYKAMLSKQEDEIYYKRFFILGIFIHLLILCVLFLYFFYFNIIKSANDKIKISFTSITYDNKYYILFNCISNCPQNSSCFDQSLIIADNNLTCSDFERILAYNITVS